MASVKKILIAISLPFFITHVMAGGMPAVPKLRTDYAGFYVEGDVAYAAINWADSSVIAFTEPPFVLPLPRGLRSGFAGGLDVGYQFNPHWAVELGSYNLPTVKLLQLTTPPNAPILLSYRSWLMYLTAKMMVPVASYVCLFFKAGPGYRKVTRTRALVRTVKAYYWAPLFGVGAQFYLTESVMISLQYERMAGYQRPVTPTSTDRLNAPSVNLVVAALGYKFYW